MQTFCFLEINQLLLIPLCSAMIKSLISKLAVTILCAPPILSNSIKNVIMVSQDASLRRDRWQENFGNTKHLTIIPEDARAARVAVMKFDTSHLKEEDIDETALLLRLFIAEASKRDDGPNVVSITRIKEDFNENHVSWGSFDYKGGDEWVEFEIHHEHSGKTGQVDISSLFVPGEDLKLAIQMKHQGHVKFASKEYEETIHHPKLVFMGREDL